MFAAYADHFPGLTRRLRQVTLAVVVLLATGLALTVWVGDGEGVTRVHFHNWTQRHYDFLRLFTDYGLYVFYLLFIGLLAVGHFRQRLGLKLIAIGYLLAQLLGSLLVVRVLKMVLGRARPDVTPLPGYESQWTGFTWEAKYHSFPSGHTADIVTSAVFAMLLVRNPILAALCLAWAAALGLSRLALAKHYPSDALVGALIALVASLIVVRYWLLPRLARATPPAHTPRWWTGLRDG